ncbi:TPA: alpha/beta fold hydrolase [Pseudomonas putida]|uniref:alpha/beta fold hydrolase n=1 Tax=Pseudomonas TaxID=286 RepID=UPI0004892ABF|nr:MULTISPECIES: alpha/beta fold hydrolase [Pseudomonas]MDD2152687.1 alpha/beta hydrolase [Pseudomonas putida]RAS21982.1 alpha/beta hydrolase family protein [Pseudomonas sp. URMO17WK12:I7]SMF62537.1 Predicted hydrolases or acyltransferases (alpha/beta hydrolase superfamily) [Pseudomonas sp. URMO17WK12:I5]HDS1679384.1 alpha/beta fold hydrolase [Pseudomonas putida]
MKIAAEKLLFLPGASGNTRFWHPVADALKTPAITQHRGWPGFGETPPNPDITCLEHLAALALAELDGPTALVAQSMGGVVAVHMALKRPELITHLILTVTSGGVNLADSGAEDWRAEFETQNPNLPRWFLDDRTDLSARLHELRMPVLLLWGDADPISPVAVGKRLAQLIPGARLEVFPEAGHDLGNSHAIEVARLIDEHLFLYA